MGAANVEEEYEFGEDPTVTNRAPSTAAPSSTAKPSADSSTVFSPELLSIYYARLFPYQLLHSWLSYDGSAAAPKIATATATSSSSVLSRREFSTTIDLNGDEIYKRYQSFSTLNELSSAIRKQCPLKIDIGAVFNYNPKDAKSLPAGKLQPTQRELVFDIDLTDYDPIRNCGCTGASICGKCWKFMVMAVEVMDEGLREDFGFEHVFWVYSGRRGVHCWVCDENARGMTNEGRSSVSGYFEVRRRVSRRRANVHTLCLELVVGRGRGLT
jgi:DNA primase small subunit